MVLHEREGRWMGIATSATSRRTQFASPRGRPCRCYGHNVLCSSSLPGSQRLAKSVAVGAKHSRWQHSVLVMGLANLLQRRSVHTCTHIYSHRDRHRQRGRETETDTNTHIHHTQTHTREEHTFRGVIGMRVTGTKSPPSLLFVTAPGPSSAEEATAAASPFLSGPAKLEVAGGFLLRLGDRLPPSPAEDDDSTSRMGGASCWKTSCIGVEILTCTCE